MPTLDDRIDEAARQLTDGQPDAAFRTRVLARLDERPRQWSPIWLLAPAAAVAIGILGLFVPWRQEDLRRTTPAGSTVRSTDSMAPPAINSEATEPNITRRPLPVGRASRRAAIAAETMAVAPTPSDLDVGSIVIVPMDLPPATFEAIEEITPLAIDSIAIEQLTAGQ